MKSKNICKFISPTSLSRFSASCFIFESDVETMKTPRLLSDNRMVLFSQGEGYALINQTSFPLSQGCIIFAFSGERFSVEPKDDCKSVEYMYIDFGGVRADELFRRFDISTAARLYQGFSGLLPLWKEALSRADEKNIDLAAESIVLYTLSRFSEDSSNKNALMGRIISLTEDRFNDPYLSISQIALELGYNPKYVSHLFKQKSGTSYSEYLRSIRIKYAVTLFDHGLDSVKNVAILSGFSDPLYFSTIFKKMMGMTPKEYKARSSF